MSSRALPTIVPVNFHFDGRQIPDEIAAAQHPRLARWASASDDRLVAISTDVVSGRRVLPGHVRAGEARDGST